MRKTLLLVLWAVWVNLFLYRPVGEFGFWLFVVGGLALVGVHVGRKSKAFVWLGVVMGLLGLQLFRVDNSFVQTVSILAVLVTGTLGAYSMMARIAFVQSITEVLAAPFRLAWNYAWTFLNGVGSFSLDPVIKRVTGKSGGTITSIFKGLVVGLPVCAVLLLLLMQADPIFQTKVNAIFQHWPEIKISQRFILTVMAVVAFLPALVMVIPHRALGSIGRIVHWLGVREAAIGMGLVAGVMAIFLIVQWPYIFAQAVIPTDLATLGISTYSEYVRKGFGELVWVAIILYGSLGVGYVTYRRHHTGSEKWFLWLQALLGLEGLVFVVSILRRVWLYQHFHGWSVVRIYGSVFLIWLLGMGSILALRYIKRTNWVKWEAIVTLGVVVFLGWWNVEQFIATTKPPTVNGQVDYMYLARMSSDGYEGWQMAMRWADMKLNQGYGPEVGGEDRKNILYSEYILRDLSSHFDYFVRKYGTDEEKRNYFDGLVKEIAVQNKTIYEYPNLSKLQVTMVERAKKDLDWASAGQSKPVTELANAIRIPYFFDQGFDSSMQFYTLQQGWPTQSLISSEWDRLLSGNQSDRHAYELMKAGDQIEKIWRLQRRAWQLHLQIMQQRESERGVEWDVSLESPLL